MPSFLPTSTGKMADTPSRVILVEQFFCQNHAIQGAAMERAAMKCNIVIILRGTN
jgi:hypothetical protein